MNTKDRILEAAIDLFAQKGYAEVSVREITRAVGIKESSLYNHFASKQQILEDILDYLNRQSAIAAADVNALADSIANMTPEAFVEYSIGSFESYLGNPVFVKIWRILSMERFHNPRARELFNSHFIDEPIDYQARMFSLLMDKGLIRRQNPMLLAREFFSYILYIYFRYIEADENVQLSNNPEFRQMIKEHMEFLNKTFSK
jgi:AcrR family transcriptional regulator